MEARGLVVLLSLLSVHAQELSTLGQTVYTTDSSTEEPIYQENAYKHDVWVRFYMKTFSFKKHMLAVLPPLSLVSNLCSLLVFLQPRRRRQNVSIVLSMLAVADTFALSLEWSQLINYLTKFSLHDKYALCDLIIYVTYVGRTCSSWYVFLFTLERFVSVKFPLKKATIVTKPRLRVTLLLITIICFLSQVYYIVFYEGYLGIICMYYRKYKYLLTTLRLSLREVFGFILPSVLTGTLNIWIILILRSWSRKQAALTSESDPAKDASKDSNNRSLTIMLLTVSTFSIVVYTPYVVMQIYTGYNTESPKTTGFLDITQAIGLLNHTCNFFFYCLGGKTFREDFICLITCGRVVPSGSMPSSVSATRLTNMSVSTISRNPSSKD